MSTHGSFFPSSSVVSPPAPKIGAIDACYLSGESIVMRRVRSQLGRIAPYVRTALISGERGIGKERVARVLHAQGPGADGPFVVHDAARFAEKLIDADQGAALLQEAHGGTLFLAKIGAVPYAHQIVLLRMLQQQEMRAQRCDLRIVASSDSELRTLMTTGQFREDLFRRIAAIEISLAPLRRRPEDIVEVAEALLREVGGSGLSTEAMIRLVEYGWPGNVRELWQVMERAATLAAGDVVDVRHVLLPEHRQKDEPHLERLQDVVRRHVLEVLTQCSGNKLRASEVLGISRSTLYRMLDACAAGVDPGYPG